MSSQGRARTLVGVAIAAGALTDVATALSQPMTREAAIAPATLPTGAMAAPEAAPAARTGTTSDPVARPAATASAAALPPPPAGYRYVQLKPAAPPPPAGYRYVQLKPAAPPPKPTTPDWEDGDPIPPGYRVREEPRHGLVTAGYVVTAIPYALSATVALSADFKNQSGYLLLPFVGPWLTLGRRSYYHCSDSRSDAGNEASDGLGCLADVFVVMGLTMDGIMQAGGGALLLTGYLATTKRLVRNDYSWSLRPQMVGTGYGLSATGFF